MLLAYVSMSTTALVFIHLSCNSTRFSVVQNPSKNRKDDYGSEVGVQLDNEVCGKMRSFGLPVYSGQL